ncbi:MAG: Tol-Pal system beta propeller repeat protein TolB [Candidatus Sumerlaeota bacterium]|nr:Tol-Pal system beta propeller repeat protein TolB [Candidatus Sumerlaeota bacterium]
MLKRWLSLWFVLFILLISLPAAHSEEGNVIQIRPSNKYVAAIAIPDFKPEAGSEIAKTGVFPEVIYRDLEISGYFVRVKNEKFVSETDAADERRGGIDFIEWNRIGANFLLKAKYNLTGNALAAECILYDVRTNQRVFGKRFDRFTRDQYRQLAHRISDEVIRYVSQESGIASTRIVYISQRGKAKEVFIMDADGFAPIALTHDANLAATPCWGFEGSEIYYTSYKEYNPDLWVVRLKDGKSGVLTSHPGFNLSPAWCEKSKKIALTLSKDGNSEIYTMDYRGSNLKRLTYNKAIDASPSWSPDGNQIVFTSDRSGRPQIYVMDSEGLNVRRLTNQGSYNDSAVWSPRGDRIAFVSRVSWNFHVFIMNVDGSNWIQLTSGSCNNEDPTWAPDGRHIAFTSDRSGRSQIYVMNDDGSNVIQLTTEGTNQSPSWSPFID